MYRVLKPRGRLLLSDPVCEVGDAGSAEGRRASARHVPDRRHSARRLHRRLTDLGFGTIEVRARRPYRVLSPRHYATDALIPIESVEICAIKDPMPADGPCVFTGRTAIYHGDDDFFDDGKGHVLAPQPAARGLRQDRRRPGRARPRRHLDLRRRPSSTTAAAAAEVRGPAAESSRLRYGPGFGRRGRRPFGPLGWASPSSSAVSSRMRRADTSSMRCCCRSTFSVSTASRSFMRITRMRVVATCSSTLTGQTFSGQLPPA